MNPLRLSDLRRGHEAVVLGVDDCREADPISRRLRELGFVEGETVRLQATGPLGREPLLIRIGNTRFALRHAEAERVRVSRSASQ